MRAKEFVTEVFTSNVSGELVRATSDLYTTKARIGGRTIVFNAAQFENDYGESVWEIDFVEYEKNGIGATFGKTGSGSELQVFSFVIESIKDLIATYHPDELIFTSSKADKNRSKLYQRMLNRVKVSGYHAEPIEHGEYYDDYFKIVKDNLSEDDSPVRIKLNNNDAANAFIQKVYAKYPNGLMVLGRDGTGEMTQFARFKLKSSFSKRGAVEIEWFETYPHRQGVGSRAMKELQELAREDGISLTLFPWDKGGTQAKLTKFYKGQGFKPIHKGGKTMKWEPISERKQYPLEDFEGLKFRIVADSGQLFVNALDSTGNNELGHVTFNIDNGKDLDPQDLFIKDKFRGQGIAKIMYDFVKSKGYKIQRSWDQTDAGAGFWNKHKGEDVRVWEQKQVDEAELDPTGWGATPQGTDVDYFGLKVKMRPSTFLKLSHPLNSGEQNSDVEKHMQGIGNDCAKYGNNVWFYFY